MIVGFDKFLTKEAYKYVLFGYVNAIRHNLPTVSVNKAIINFMKYHGLNDDSFNLDSARVTYNNMAREYMNFQSTAENTAE